MFFLFKYRKKLCIKLCSFNSNFFFIYLGIPGIFSIYKLVNVVFVAGFIKNDPSCMKECRIFIFS
jgi:hypothetical protein